MTAYEQGFMHKLAQLYDPTTGTVPGFRLSRANLRRVGKMLGNFFMSTARKDLNREYRMNNRSGFTDSTTEDRVRGTYGSIPDIHAIYDFNAASKEHPQRMHAMLGMNTLGPFMEARGDAPGVTGEKQDRYDMQRAIYDAGESMPGSIPDGWWEDGWPKK